VTATAIATVTTGTTITTTNAAITTFSLLVFYVEKVEAALPTDNIEKQFKDQNMWAPITAQLQHPHLKDKYKIQVSRR
jgi:hypothetical protein